MGEIVELGKIIKREEFANLEKRVRIIENALKIENSSQKKDYQKKAYQYASNAGILFGCSIDPIDIRVEPTSNLIGSEFSIIECPKACIPTTERIMTDYGPQFDFSLIDTVSIFAEDNDCVLKDGPYLNLSNQKHPVNMNLNQLTVWASERLQRIGAVSPDYIDVASDFLTDAGRIISSNVFKLSGFYGGIINICNIISEVAEDSGIGLTASIEDFTTEKNTDKIDGLVQILNNLLESGCPLQYVGINITHNTDKDINHSAIKSNLKKIESTGIPEIHLSNFLLKHGKNKNKNVAELYKNFISSISDDAAVSVVSLKSPTTLSGYPDGLFNEHAEKTAIYEAVCESFLKMSQ